MITELVLNTNMKKQTRQVLLENCASILSIISDTTNSCFRPSIDAVVPAMVSNSEMLDKILGNYWITVRR